jgi:hypothetical protein
MSSGEIPAFLRPVALVLAALVLPHCSSDIGNGDVVRQVTVRISGEWGTRNPTLPA